MNTSRIDERKEFETAVSEAENLCRSRNAEKIGEGVALLRKVVDDGYLPAQKILVNLLLEGVIPSHAMSACAGQQSCAPEFNKFAGFTPGHRTGVYRKQS